MKKVLIVNDCKFESLIMKDYLSDIGYSVQVTNEYNVFLQIKVFEPDIVIVNLIMKDTTGDKIVSHVKIAHPEIICLLSSCDSLRLEDFSYSKVDEVIHTPINRSRLSEILDKTISKVNINKPLDEDVSEIIQRLNVKNSSANKYKNIKPNIFLFCPYCGHKFEEKDQNFFFCPYCGQALKS
jgi:response regulator RpfG family c-di-GMP phosphodiesterase